MSLSLYNNFKDRYHNTAPIRGRSTDIRPIAQRRRDWEQVVKRYIVEEGALDVEGGEAYGAHLYQTDCVMYMANGDMHIKTNGWDTPTTAEFINRYIPRNMRCYKKYNKMWVEHMSQAYVLDGKKAITFRYHAPTDTYSVENPIQLTQKVVDRAKMKVARDKLKGFRDYAKIMLKLADGWLTEELVTQHATGERDYYGRPSYEWDGNKYDAYKLSGSIGNTVAESLYNAMCGADESQYPKLLCMMCAGSNFEESRVVRTENAPYLDYQGKQQMKQTTIRENRYKHTTVDNRINHIIKQVADVYTTRAVAMGVVATNTL